MSETLSDEGASMSKACMIEEDNECETNRVDEVAVNNTTRADDDHGQTSSTLDPET